MRRGGKQVRRSGGSAQGSVSVYFIAATAAIVLLGALLIDFSRIAAFRHLAELSMQSGVRSVLASYDLGFYQKYGLFIRGGEDGGALLRTTLEGYAGPQSAGGFPYLEIGWPESGVTESRPLADHEVFRRQVLEEMKIKAPVDLALELTSRFRGLAPAMQEAAVTVDRLERLRQAFDRREAALDQALAAQVQAGEGAVSRLRDRVPFPSVSLAGRRPAGEAVHLADAALQYADYVSKRQTLIEIQKQMAQAPAPAPGAGPAPPIVIPLSLLNAVSGYESSVGRLARTLNEVGPRVTAETEAGIAHAVDALQQAREANAEMKAIAAEASNVPPGSEGGGQAGVDPAGEHAGDAVDPAQVGVLKEIRQTAAQLVRDDGFFEEYLAELQAVSAAGSELGQAVSQAASLLGSVPGSSGLGGELLDRASRLQSQLADFAADYAQNGAVIRERRASIESMRTREGERKALGKEAQEEWKDWAQLSGTLGGGQAGEDEKEDFARADRLARENLEWNRQEDASSSERFETGNLMEGKDAAMRRSNEWLSALSEASAGVRDSLYFSEYAHLRLPRSAPADVKRMLEGGTALPFERQEEEYVLYGFANPTGNIAAAYGEIFAFRLAIRTMEGLIESRGLGHPLLILAAALVYGVRNAVQDIHSLLERDSVPLSKYMKAQTAYADYLRLFYLLHGDAPVRLSRFIAVMEQETGLNLAEAYTYAEAEGTASLRLWFFSGLMKVLGRTGQLGGTVEGNRYEAEFAADSAYQ